MADSLVQDGLSPLYTALANRLNAWQELTLSSVDLSILPLASFDSDFDTKCDVIQSTIQKPTDVELDCQSRKYPSRFSILIRGLIQPQPISLDSVRYHKISPKPWPHQSYP